MSVSMDALFYADEDVECPKPPLHPEYEERKRREHAWATQYPNEWEEWLCIRPLLNSVIDFTRDDISDFDDFLREVGRRPSEKHRVVRLNEHRPLEQGNMAWAATPVETPSSPYLNAKQAAAYLGISLRTLYNNRRHIPALPGFRTLMFDPKVLDGVRASMKFRTKRLAEQRKSRDRKIAA